VVIIANAVIVIFFILTAYFLLLRLRGIFRLTYRPQNFFYSRFLISTGIFLFNQQD
jgi:hypothetical protein